jgi:hypothetical protein
MADFGSNFINALTAGHQARAFSDEREARQYVEPAMRGDSASLAKLTSLDPKMSVAVTTALQRMDANQRAQTKEQAEWAAGAANAVLQADPAERANVYTNLRAEGVRRGYKMTLPEQYSPQIDPYLRSVRLQAVPITEWFKQNEGMPTPMGGGAPMPTGGGAPAGWPGTGAPAVVPPKDLPTGQKMVQGLVQQGLSPVAAASIVGNLYQESGFNPAAVGDNGTAYGMGQWRNDRAVALGQFAQTQGKPPTDPQVQVAFLLNEMRNGDEGARRAFQLLQTAKTPEEGTAAMMHFFRPQGYTPQNPQAGHGYTQRVQYSQSLLPAQMPNPPAGLAPSTPTAPMPGAPAGLTPPGPPPAQMPGGPPMDGTQPVTQGDANVAPAPAPSAPQGLTQGIKLPPGARMMGIKGVPVVKDGNVLIIHPDGRQDWLPLPKPNQDAWEDVRNPAGQIVGQRNKVTNEFKPVAETGEKPPQGYRNIPGGAQEPIPGGPADPAVLERNAAAKRAANEKAIPQTVVKGMTDNLNSLKQIDRAETLLNEHADSVGGWGSWLASWAPGAGDIQNRWGDPAGVRLRALIADIGSMKIHDRSGAAVTASEYPRLRPFIPSIGDKPDVIRDKLANFKAEYTAILQDTASYYGPENGFKAHGPTVDYLSSGNKGTGKPDAASPSPATNVGPKSGDVEDGYRFKGGDPGKRENWEPAQ